MLWSYDYEGRQGPLGTYYGVLFEVALEGVTTQQ